MLLLLYTNKAEETEMNNITLQAIDTKATSKETRSEWVANQQMTALSPAHNSFAERMRAMVEADPVAIQVIRQ